MNVTCIQYKQCKLEDDLESVLVSETYSLKELLHNTLGNAQKEPYSLEKTYAPVDLQVNKKCPQNAASGERHSLPM